MERKKIIEIAEKEIGYQEQPTNQTKYGAWFGLNCVPWCGIFVSWVYAKSGVLIKKGGFLKGFAGCQTFSVKYADKETKNPQEGDIVLFDWNADKKFDHTGIFVKWINSEMFQCIEGNTSIGNNSNGGKVMLRIRIKSQSKFYNLID